MYAIFFRSAAQVAGYVAGAALSVIAACLLLILAAAILRVLQRVAKSYLALAAYECPDCARETVEAGRRTECGACYSARSY